MMAQEVRQTSVPTLYNMTSSQSFVIVWALEEVAASYGIRYNLKNLQRSTKGWPNEDTQKTLKEAFPLGKSPIVELEFLDGGAEQTYQYLPNTLTESRLILQFISDNYTKGEWIPETEKEKRRDAFFQEIAKCSLLPKIDIVVCFEFVASLLPFGLRHLMQLMFTPITNHFIQDQNEIYKIMDNCLSDELPWFSGTKMGLADLNMSFGMDMASQRRYFDPKKFPKVAKWYATVLERPAYKSAREKGGSYDLVTFA